MDMQTLEKEARKVHTISYKKTTTKKAQRRFQELAGPAAAAYQTVL